MATMVNYEYRFISLQAVGMANELASPVDTSNVAYEHFATLTSNGWRIKAMSINPRYTDQVLIALERAAE